MHGGINAPPMRLMGIPVSDLDCAVLIDLLRQVGRVEDLELAARIDRALDANVYLLGLSPAERDRLLSVLVDPPESLPPLPGRARQGPPRPG